MKDFQFKISNDNSHKFSQILGRVYVDEKWVNS